MERTYSAPSPLCIVSTSSDGARTRPLTLDVLDLLQHAHLDHVSAVMIVNVGMKQDSKVLERFSQPARHHLARLSDRQIVNNPTRHNVEDSCRRYTSNACTSSRTGGVYGGHPAAALNNLKENRFVVDEVRLSSREVSTVLTSRTRPLLSSSQTTHSRALDSTLPD